MTTEAQPSRQEQLDEITVNIPDAIASRVTAGTDQIAASGEAPGLAASDHAPDFTLPDALGHDVSLADLRAKGPADQNADGTRSLPVPGTFVIDRDGTVAAAFVSADYRERVDPARIEAALRDLTAS